MGRTDVWEGDGVSKVKRKGTVRLMSFGDDTLSLPNESNLIAALKADVARALNERDDAREAMYRIQGRADWCKDRIEALEDEIRELENKLRDASNG